MTSNYWYLTVLVLRARVFVLHTGGMMTRLLRIKPFPVTLCPPLSVKNRQGDVDLRLFKTIPLTL